MGRSSRASRLGRSGALGLALAIVGADLSAHRRDEFLQAARLAIDPANVQIELDLTPGIAVADAIVGDIDRDRDGGLSADEQRNYATRTIRALQVEVDGLGLPLHLDRSRFPDIAAMRRGEGSIRINFSAPIQPLSAGDHQLLFRNRHHRESSVYLANALVPESHRVAVRAQHRDADQRELTIDYSLAADSISVMGARPIGSLAVGVLLLGLAIRRAFIIRLQKPRR